MSELFVLRALLFAGECLLGSALLFAFASLAARLVGGAGLRHAVWLGAFAAALVLPLAALVVPASIVFERPIAAAAAEPAIPSTVEQPVVREASVAPAPAPAFALPALGARDVAVVLLMLWSLGVVFALSQLCIGAFGLSALRRNSKPHALASADLPALAARGRECELRLSSGEEGPLAWGLLKPVILLPRSAATWPRARLHAVLLHELAHVRRRDSLTQLLAFIVCALYWPNPLVWMAVRALRRDAEIAADDHVIVSGIKPSVYAGELLELAGAFRGRRALGVAMAGRSALEARVKSALAPNQVRSGVSMMDMFKIACLGVAVTALLAFARPDVVDAKDVTQKELPAVDMSAPAAEPTPVAEPAPQAQAEDPAPVVIEDEEGPSRNVVIRETRDRHGRKIEKSVRIVHLDRVNHARIQAAVDEAHRAEVEIARIQPEIDRAIAAAKIDEKTARAMERIEPQIRAQVARAIAKAQPAIHQAMIAVRASAEHMRASAKAQAHADVRIESDSDEDAADHDEDTNVEADEADEPDADEPDHDEDEPDHN